MKNLFPYWWFSWFRKSKDNNKFEYSSYVIYRHALENAHLDSNQRNITAPYPSSSPKAVAVLEIIYQQLSILDTKASALMRLNGVMLAAAAFLLGSHLGIKELETILVTSSFIGLLLSISGVTSLISIALCLLVISIDWTFLGLVKPETTAEGKTHLNFSEEFFHLQKVVDFRVLCYRFAWIASLIATFSFLTTISIVLYNLI